MKWQYNVRDMPENEVASILVGVSSAVWEKVTKGRAGRCWGGGVEKVWEDTGGNQEETLSIEVCEVQDRSERKDKKEGKG